MWHLQYLLYIYSSVFTNLRASKFVQIHFFVQWIDLRNTVSRLRQEKLVPFLSRGWVVTSTIMDKNRQVIAYWNKKRLALFLTPRASPQGTPFLQSLWPPKIEQLVVLRQSLVNLLVQLASLRGRRYRGRELRKRDRARGRREEGNACKQAIVFAIPPAN